MKSIDRAQVLLIFAEFFQLFEKCLRLRFKANLNYTEEQVYNENECNLLEKRRLFSIFWYEQKIASRLY